MTVAMEAVIKRLASLPDEVQDAIAPRLNTYLTRLDELRALIQEGLDSGTGRVAEEVFVRLAARYERSI